MLLTKLEDKFFKENLKVVTKLTVTFPFDWNSDSQELAFTKSRWKLQWYYFKFVLTSAYSIHLLMAGNPFSHVNLAQTTVLGLVKLFIHVVLIFSQTIQIVAWITLQLHLKTFLYFTKQLQILTHQKQTTAPRRNLSWIQQKCLQFFDPACKCVWILYSIFLYVTQGSSFHIDYVLPDDHRNLFTHLFSCLLIACFIGDCKCYILFMCGEIGRASCRERV